MLLSIREQEEAFLNERTEDIELDVSTAKQSLRFSLKQHEHFNEFYENRKKRKASSSTVGPS